MSQPITIEALIGTTALLAVLQFLVSLWLSERFKAQLQRETGVFLESIRWELRVREQAAKVAEYMALARDLREDSSVDEYRRANQLGWELSLWLPADIYRLMGRALASPNERENPLSVLVEVRRLLLNGRLGELTIEEMLSHAPGIGKFRSLVAKSEVL
ncbi:MAG: hypothetical protein V5B38_20715 [Candidatus Accumulibacter propinquus]|jgi:hypothetical protein